MKSNVRKHMCVLFVKGTFKKYFFSKGVTFEIYFYYTPIKKKIVDYSAEGLTPHRLGLGQVIGISVSEVEELALSKGYSLFRIER